MNVLTAVSLWTLVTIIPSVMSQLRCQASDISFQLLSGYVYTNTDDIIKTVVSRTNSPTVVNLHFQVLLVSNNSIECKFCELDVLIKYSIISLLFYELTNSINKYMHIYLI